jgi:hypothetical protein
MACLETPSQVIFIFSRKKGFKFSHGKLVYFYFKKYESFKNRVSKLAPKAKKKNTNATQKKILGFTRNSRENTCECEARTVQLPDVKRPTCVHLGAPPWPRPRAAAYTCRPNQRGPSVPPPARSKRVRGGPTAAAEFVYGSVHLTGPHYPNLYKFAEKTSGTRRRRPIIRPQPQRTRDSQPATPRTQTQRSDRVDRPAERRFV